MRQTEYIERPSPSVGVSVLVFLSILTVIMTCMQLGSETSMAVLFGAIVAMMAALLLGTSWQTIEICILENIKKCSESILIMAMVGILVGIWIIGGGVSYLIYYGIKFIHPAIILPISFVLCMITSLLTGTSFGSVATIGLVLYGIGVNLGVSDAMMAAAVITGASWGDKMSPISDTTNLAAAMSGTDVYSHIYSMLYTITPGTLISLFAYSLLSFQGADGIVNENEVMMIMETLQGHYTISFWCMVPMLLVIVLGVLRIPSLVTLSIVTVISMGIAVITQNIPVSYVMDAALNGNISHTGVSVVDAILNRGGLISMMEVTFITLFACVMAGSLQASGVISSLLKGVILKLIHTTKSLVFFTLTFVYGIMAGTGSQSLGLVIPGSTMGSVYDKMNIDHKVLSRTLEDAATVGAPLIPWTSVATYFTTVLGCDFNFIPYAFLCYLTPVFSMICACTCFGIWDSQGKRMWNKEKIFFGIHCHKK